MLRTTSAASSRRRGPTASAALLAVVGAAWAATPSPWPEVTAAWGTPEFRRARARLPDAAGHPDGTLLAARVVRTRGLRGCVAEEVLYASGGCRVAGYRVTPPAASARPVPALLFPRGGVTVGTLLRRTNLSYLARLASAGPYVVLATQYRGWREGTCVDQLGGADVRDVVSLAALADASPGVDPERRYAYGPSRGGSMILQALRAGLRLDAAVTVGAPLDVADTWRHSGRALRLPVTRALGGTPDQVPEVYARRSPVSWPEAIETPVLVLHGGKDSVVPARQARAFAAALQQAWPDGRHRVEVRRGGDHLLMGRGHAKARDEAALAWFAAHPGGDVARAQPTDL